jgi:hypothetical protein
MAEKLISCSVCDQFEYGDHLQMFDLRQVVKSVFLEFVDVAMGEIDLIDVLRDASQEVPAQDSEIVALEVQQADGFVFWKIRRNLVQLLVAAQQLAPSAHAGPVVGQVAKVGGVVVLRRWSLLVDVIPVTVRV